MAFAITRNMRRTLAAVLWLLVVTASAQDARRLARDTVAWVDGMPILSSELRARIELMPWPEPIRPSTMDSVRSHALSAMIAERLLATDALLQGVGTTSEIERMRRGLTRVLLQDALFRSDVVGAIQPTRSQLTEALRRHREQRTVLAILASSEREARAIGVEIRQAKDRSKIVASFGPPRVLDRDTVIVSFGMTDTVLENSVYSIGKDKVSVPTLISGSHWMVFVLLERTDDPDAVKQSSAEQQRQSRRVVQKRLDESRALQVYGSILDDKRAQADSETFDLLAETVSDIWSEDTARYRRPEGYQFTSDMVDVVLGRLGAERDRPLIALDDRSMSLEDVVEAVRYETFVSPERSGNNMLARLNALVRNIAAGEYLAREARARNLHQTSEFLLEVQRWSDYWAAGQLLQRIRDTVTVTLADRVAYLIEHREEFRGQAQVNVDVINSTTPETAPTGWFDPSDAPVMGFHALLADSGAVVGPITLGSGAVTFRVAGVRFLHGSAGRDPLLTEIEAAARVWRSRQSVDRHLASLSQRHPVRVDPQAVRKVEITSVPMFTRRYLGFGASMTGAPLLLPLWEWIKQLPPGSTWPL